MDNFTQSRIRAIAFSANKARVDLRGLPHESAEDFLSRGGHITKCPSCHVEMPTRMALPTHKMTKMGQTLYDWRV